MKFLLSSLLLASAGAVNPEGWTTCGGLEPSLNRTACPSATATCCTQKWSPSQGQWGCIDFVNATCCKNGYTACPSGHVCRDTGSSWAVVTECVPQEDIGVKSRGDNGEEERTAGKASAYRSKGAAYDKNLGSQVCKQGAPLALSTTLKNVLILGDSVSIGYTPPVADLLKDTILVQHTPWGGDGGAEESHYAYQCLDYLLRAPDGTPLRPDILYFNSGLHNCLKDAIIPGQSDLPQNYAPYLEKIAAALVKWAAPTAALPEVKLLFALTSPMLNNVTIDDIVLDLNKQAASIMAKHNIPTVDLHGPIIEKCGQVPTDECFGAKNCFSPHCPAGYAWLANSTVAPAIVAQLQ